MDVYDEVDRRETDSLWNKTEVLIIIIIIVTILTLSALLFQVRSQNTVPVPFLPVNPDYSATRNQVIIISPAYYSTPLEF